MKTQHINILMIEDHPMILESYVEVIEALQRETENYRFEIFQAHSILDAINSLDDTFDKRQLHLVFLDIGLPKENKYMTGLDLGTAIRREFPDVKIIIITGYDNFPIIQKALNTVKPDGLLIKAELSPEGLIIAVKDVLQDIPHYTKTVRKYLNHIETKPSHLDRYDMLLLFHISEGKKTQELPAILPLSLTSIERRKRKLKEILKLETDSSDVQLLIRAKEMGFL